MTRQSDSTPPPVAVRPGGPLWRTAFLCRLVAAAWLLASVPAQPQDLDLVLYAGDPSKRTLLDQVEDPGERAAFEAIQAAGQATERRALSERFLERFPQSWLVGFAHSIAAKACIDLGDLDAGLEHGRKSIRLLPENGTLLVALANAQVVKGLLDEAESSARDALEHLARFQRPARYSREEWAQIQNELEASAHFVLGRVAATRGLRAAGEARDTGLAEARTALRRSVGMNRRDGIALLLLGLVEAELGNRGESLSALEAAARLPGPVQERAVEELRKAHRSSGASAGTLNHFRSAIRPLRIGRESADDGDRRRNAAPSEYAGSEGCRDCHEEVFDAWSETGMARMFRPYSYENVIGDFTDGSEFRSPGGELLARMLVEDGRHYFELPAEGTTKRFRVDYTIGSKWQQAYATRLPDGRIHVVPIQYNRIHRQWVNFWEVLDDGPSERSRVRNFHRMERQTSYQLHCSSCHTSQVQAEGAVVVPDRITFREAGINCEMCHGPSRAHQRAMQQGRPRAKEADLPPLRFSGLDHRSYVAVCAQCHMQSSIIEVGPLGEINYSGKEESFLDRRRQRPYEEFSRKAFYKDGRFRETTFIVESFVRSQCYRQGQAHCGDCHDPHPPDSASNPTSLKHRDDPNRMCLQCHEAIGRDAAAHTKHAPESEASLCTACHMPRIMNSMMFLAGTHRIDDIPDASMTRRFGREESPNACFACHEGESAEWLERSLAGW